MPQAKDTGGVQPGNYVDIIVTGVFLVVKKEISWDKITVYALSGFF
jgi:hypothetical protein